MTENPFFDSLNSLLVNGLYWMTDETREKQYAPLGVNVGLSQHIDAILHVNEMNKYWLSVSPQMHYDYCFHSIRKMKRPFKKWSKKLKHEDILMLMDHFQVNRKRAMEYFELLDDQQIDKIYEDREKGTT